MRFAAPAEAPWRLKGLEDQRLGGSEGGLEQCCGGLGRSWDGLGQSLGGLWADLGGLGAVSERSWGDLGAVLGDLGAVLGILGRSGAKMLIFQWFCDGVAAQLPGTAANNAASRTRGEGKGEA